MTTLLKLTEAAAEPVAAAGEAVFRVVEGPGSWVRALETNGSGAAGRTEVDPASTWFEEIFAAPDARPLARSAPFVFKIEIDVHDEVDLDEFDDWYNRTHVPEVNPAGLLGGRRYRALAHGRRFLATYDMADRHVLGSEALAKVRGFARFNPVVTIRHRTVLERISP